jgi:hypothetical protein
MKLQVLVLSSAIALSMMVKTSVAHANGVDFERLCGGGIAATFNQNTCQNFILGEVSGIAIAKYPKLICFPADFDPRQALPIVQLWMRSHPQKLNESEAVVVANALSDAYPCHY